MTPEELELIVSELGWTWTLTADYLIRDPRTVRRWRDSVHPIPAVAANAMRSRPRALAFELWIDTLRGG